MKTRVTRSACDLSIKPSMPNLTVFGLTQSDCADFSQAKYSRPETFLPKFHTFHACSEHSKPGMFFQ
jgi:hypothetical protein